METKVRNSIACSVVVSVLFLGANSAEVSEKYIQEQPMLSSTQEEIGNIEPYTMFVGNEGIVVDYKGYNDTNQNKDGINQMVMNDDKLATYNKLMDIASLEDNWNQNGAYAFSKDFIDETWELLVQLPIQPEVFPTAGGTLQIEYDKENGEHLEIEFGELTVGEAYLVGLETEEEFDVDINVASLSKVVEEFYG